MLRWAGIRCHMTHALVIRTAGTNCNQELARAFELAGASVEQVHLNALIEDPSPIEKADFIGFPGGFTYGDDIASGRVFATRARQHLYPALRAAAQRGCLMIGICNGFQILVQSGLLPGYVDSGEDECVPVQAVALTENAGGMFQDRWVSVEPVDASVCVWTQSLPSYGQQRGPDIMQLPIAHAEGRFVARDDATLQQLESAGQVALRYTNNPNGSMGDVAGICDATGRIFGLMPHPERFVRWTDHPYWTRLDASDRTGDTPGLLFFRDAVRSALASV